MGVTPTRPAERDAAERRCWLIKSEPNAFSFDALMAAHGRTTPWDGVRNYQARNFMRDEMREGDAVIFYHSSATPPGAVGLAEVASAPRPDPTQFDASSRYADPTSDPADPRWYLVDIRGVRALPRIVSLREIKAHPVLRAMTVAQRGSRLSVMPLACEHLDVIVALASGAGPSPEGGD
jgi:predicted RNA-binding protein with PUA-like domain